jgi:hypothetical protein
MNILVSAQNTITPYAAINYATGKNRRACLEEMSRSEGSGL